VFQLVLHFIQARCNLFSGRDALQTRAFVYLSDLWVSEISFLFLQTLRSFSPILCHFILTRRKRRLKDKAGVEVTSSCVHWGHALFQCRSRLLLFFWHFMKAADSQVNVSKCQGVICIAGYDPKKIWHATLVSHQKKGKWLKKEEVGMDEEKRGKGEGPNLSGSHDRRIAQIAGGSLCPHPLQCILWWMGHLILPCLRVLLECICPSPNTKTTLLLRQPGHKLVSVFKV